MINHKAEIITYHYLIFTIMPYLKVLKLNLKFARAFLIFRIKNIVLETNIIYLSKIKNHRSMTMH